MSAITYQKQTAKTADIESHLLNCDAFFKPKLSSYVNIHEYSDKISKKAITFEAWHLNTLIGLVAVYYNKKEAYITNVSVIDTYVGIGIAKKLLLQAIEKAIKYNSTKMSLIVHKNNTNALLFYKKIGFKATTQESMTINMFYNLEITNG